MPMEHKAFEFDYDSFNKELKPILELALSSQDIGGLVAFINDHSDDLSDPYEGEPMSEEWQSMIETHDAHQYGDFALTMFYDPKDDIGLGASWQHVQTLIANDSSLLESPILGTPIGSLHAPFDPGKMGAYFQTAEQVRRHHQYLVSLQDKFPNDNDLKAAVQMLARAKNSEKGLYVTF